MEWHKIPFSKRDILFFLLLVFGSATFIAMYYGQSWKTGVADAGFFVIQLVLGLFLLVNMLHYYPPSKINAWPALLFSLVVSVLLVFGGKWLARGILDTNAVFFVFYEKSIPARLGIMFLLLYCVAIFMLLIKNFEKGWNQQQLGEMSRKLSKDAELFYLRQQLQPHFLFNSLNSISALLGSDPKKARLMLQELADFFRASLKKDPMKWERVDEEYKIISQYLSIEKVRFGHRLDFRFNMEEGVGDLMVPPLLIQPLVENAIKHGLYGVTGDILIEFTAKKEGNYFVIVITNPCSQQSGGPRGVGFGLESVERRLYLLFGRKDLLHYKKDNDNFTVSMKIPQPK
ncbi:sensor histidine kinase [Negadavirga shengliensis]|uniref:Sensor histidine kinase n=1 Tax=Negadavirga shengliensis TaxID=1389218 RepID=A0ABV9T255_9BACT